MAEQKAKKQDRAEYPVTPEEFIEVWQTSNSAEEVVKRVSDICLKKGGKKMPKAIVHARASSYRNMGIKLKRMPRPNKGIDVEAMNRFVEEVDRKRGADTEPAKPRKEMSTLAPDAVKEIVKQVVQEVSSGKKKAK